MRSIYILSIFIVYLFSVQTSFGAENVGDQDKKRIVEIIDEGRAMNCDPAIAIVDLNINNIRAGMRQGGDLWWDGTDAQYEAPKLSGIHAIFAGAIWIGGIDAGGQLKTACQTYRASGNDFWAGPLSCNGITDVVTCEDWDQHWKVNRTAIDSFKAGLFVNPPARIRDWPAVGNPNSSLVGRAPFVDVNSDGVYNPADGDYPDVLGDQAIWWVYNDNGNTHTETGGKAIGMEIHAMAFAAGASGTTILNDVTFNKYTLINRSSNVLDSTFFGQWVDPDLGCHLDDYVGCDTSRAMGICYNGDADDDAGTCAGTGVNTYGLNPPLLGVALFEGPKDENGNELGMSAFLYYNNDATAQGNPDSASHYYRYLTGTWKDNTPFTEGGTGKGGTTPTKFIFPDDPALPLPAWSECTNNNLPADRRFVMSSGPFKLLPGAVNNLTIAVLWIRPTGVYPCPSFNLLALAMDTVEFLFDSTLVNNTCLEPISNFSWSNNIGKTKTFTDSSLNLVSSWCWYFGDGTSDNGKNPMHTYLDSGFYEVCLSVANNCSFDQVCNIVHVTDTSSGITDALEYYEMVSIYPSITDDEVWIQTLLGPEDEIEINVFDLKGRLVRTHLTRGAGKVISKISLRGEPSGMYLVQVRVGDKITNKKIFLGR